ncbi:MAG: 2-nitropropane dioxygenase [Acidobacteriota bacterium]|nr:2-nitropropane dioxygenase [Acidobacteriota bacterium]
MEKLTVICPCCDTTLTLDANSGALLAHEEKTKAHGSFEDLRGELDKQKELREQIFAQETLAQKDRSRILEEKFEEAKKRAAGDLDKPFKNPLDFD